MSKRSLRLGATLLLALVVGCATARTKAEQDAQAFRQALEQKDKQISQWQDRARKADGDVAAAKHDLKVAEGRIADLNDPLARSGRARSAIVLSSDALFKPGGAQLSTEGKQALLEIAESIKVNKQFIQVEGHADASTIAVSHWRSSWELGAGRALAVLRFLIDKGGIEPSRLSAATFGDAQPVGADKVKNRRVVIALYDALPASGK
jgi:flagellar motor protein MotB